VPHGTYILPEQTLGLIPLKAITLLCQFLSPSWIWQILHEEVWTQPTFLSWGALPHALPTLILGLRGNWGMWVQFHLCPRVNGNEYGAASP